MGRAEDLFDELVRDGEAAVDRLIADRAAEELFLDFKRSADDGKGRKLHDNDRANLAKAISGFGNSEGGVLVWGVECKDLPTAKHELHDPKLFVSRLQGAVSGCTLPPHTGVRHAAIELPGNATGFAITLVPRSEFAPHQAVKPASPYYYVRAGSDFVPGLHGVISGMFGRRPQARIWHQWAPYPVAYAPPVVAFEVAVNLVNGGPGVVRDAYLNVSLTHPGGPSVLAVAFHDTRNWDITKVYRFMSTIVAKDTYKLVPHTLSEPCRLQFRLHPPFEGPLACELTYGHAEPPVSRISSEIEPADLQAAYDAIVTEVTGGAQHVWPSRLMTLLDDPARYTLT